MSGASKQRTRPERIDSLGIQKPRLIQWWQNSDKADFATRVLIAIVAAVSLLVLCQTWQPPFAHRRNTIPPRDLVTRVSFEVPNEAETRAARERSRRDQLAYYSNDQEQLGKLREELNQQLFLILDAEKYEDLSSDEERTAFARFANDDEAADEDPGELFAALKRVLADDEDIDKLNTGVGLALEDNSRMGLLRALEHTPEEGSQSIIRVYETGIPEKVLPVPVKEVQIAQAREGITKRLREYIRTQFPGDDGQTVAITVSRWIEQRLPTYETLRYDAIMSEEARIEAAAAVPTVMTPYRTASVSPVR